MLQQTLQLSGLHPRFQGNARLVFIHPENPDWFVKVPKAEWIAKSQKVPAWKKRFKPLGANSVNMHEFREIMRINPKPEVQLPHLFTVIGLQQTDLGWGLIVAAEKDENGVYARPLVEWAKDTSAIEEALKNFKHWALDTDAILYDLNPWNLVLAYRNGRHEIVVIDGISEKSALQTRTYFPSVNKKKNKQVYERFLKHMEMWKDKDI